MKKVILKIGGMSCSGCSSTLEKHLNKQDTIISASVNLVMAQALIFYDDSLNIEDLTKYIKEAGFENLGIFNNQLDDKKEKKETQYLILFFLISFLIMFISMIHMIDIPMPSIIDKRSNPQMYSIILTVLTFPFLFYGQDIVKKGTKNLIHKTPNMDTLVTLGVLSSLFYSLFSTGMILLGYKSYVEYLYFDSCTMIIFFIKLGRYIENKSKEKTKEAIAELVQITPRKALKKMGEKEIEITIDEVKKGDILIAKPGMKIAVDGIIIEGSTHVKDSFITGEAYPSKKEKEDKVLAGSMNIDGYIEYKAQKIGKDSTISEMVRLVVESTGTKPPIARLADKVCAYFTPFILILSIITFLVYLLIGESFNQAFTTFVTILVVSCPCALGLATPLAITISEGLCAKNLILVKKSETLEKATNIDTIVFDKTGTLTYGKVEIAKIHNYSTYSEKELLTKVASIENKSSHPIAKVFKKYSEENNLVLENVLNFQNIEGIGITAEIENKKIYLGNNKLLAKLKLGYNKQFLDEEKKLSKQGNSIVYVIEENKIIGLIGLSDIIREEAKEVIEKLKSANKEIIMLTGDNLIYATTIAQTLGIKNIIANVLPQEKHKKIKDLKEEGKKVMMIGDGINDAPSLALADIGVSFTNATDIAVNTADVVLLNDNLSKILTLLNISKKTIKNIKQNLFWAFCYNIIMIQVAMGLFKGFHVRINPMLASMFMMLSSLTVIFNALSLKRFKEK
ncbi:MAG: copper-translocating P-type ATPase [Bacilli bacterium]|nr:copper-translocating P-type ATPase [Bacilli bacterium]